MIVIVMCNFVKQIHCNDFRVRKQLISHFCSRAVRFAWQIVRAECTLRELHPKQGDNLIAMMPSTVQLLTNLALPRIRSMRFHYIGEVFNTGEDAAELREVFYFYNKAQVGNAAVYIHFYIGNVDAFI